MGTGGRYLQTCMWSCILCGPESEWVGVVGVAGEWLEVAVCFEPLEQREGPLTTSLLLFSLVCELTDGSEVLKREKREPGHC